MFIPLPNILPIVALFLIRFTSFCATLDTNSTSTMKSYHGMSPDKFNELYDNFSSVVESYVALPPTTSEELSKNTGPLPIETAFKFPTPVPNLGTGVGFSTGSIDIGGIELRLIKDFTKVWAALEGGPNDKGATFYDPSEVPEGFFMFGSYAQTNTRALFGWVLVGRDASGGREALKAPHDYLLIWSSESATLKQEGIAYFWLPLAVDGYSPIGIVVTSSPEKPPLDKVRCVRNDFTDPPKTDELVWSNKDQSFNVCIMAPANIGVQAQGVMAGTFAGLNGASLPLPCLRNNRINNRSASPYLRDRPAYTFPPTPSLTQIETLVAIYAPVLHFHPDEAFYTSSVNWFFDNGALLYTNTTGTPTSERIAPDGTNLPQDGTDDDAYWLDLPADDDAKSTMVKKGNLSSTEPYVHVKPMFGSTFTDIVLWFFYPYNGPARAKVAFIQYFKLGNIGEHVGDWEHVTLRINNFNGELWYVFLSQHSTGQWVHPADLEFEPGTNKASVYVSYHGHAMYRQAGLVMQGKGKVVGIRNDAKKGGATRDAGLNFRVVAAEHLTSAEVDTPPWINYMRKWGPKLIHQEIVKELDLIIHLLPPPLRGLFRNFVNKLPLEVFQEEGPTGPKGKTSWLGDEPQ